MNPDDKSLVSDQVEQNLSDGQSTMAMHEVLNHWEQPLTAQQQFQQQAELQQQSQQQSEAQRSARGSDTLPSLQIVHSKSKPERETVPKTLSDSGTTSGGTSPVGGDAAPASPGRDTSATPAAGQKIGDGPTGGTAPVAGDAVPAPLGRDTSTSQAGSAGTVGSGGSEGSAIADSASSARDATSAHYPAQARLSEVAPPPMELQQLSAADALSAAASAATTGSESSKPGRTATNGESGKAGSFDFSKIFSKESPGKFAKELEKSMFGGPPKAGKASESRSRSSGSMPHSGPPSSTRKR